MNRDEARAKAVKLLALATNKAASVEEARSAAMACCRLLEAHGLLEAGATSATPPGASSRQSEPYREWERKYEEAMRRAAEQNVENLRRQAAAREAAESHAKPPMGRNPFAYDNWFGYPPPGSKSHEQRVREAESAYGAQWVTKPKVESVPHEGICGRCSIRGITDKSKNWCNVCLQGSAGT